ncbi:erg26, C-3 sterol dehydrogenase [Yamadazyma tenuis]|uniref:Sterol-4-alpha-carboxylate 3-dehydrogenase ERG26, decarboxylating n=1 Tax=Candida tenuis (strain ATCC 10573 / BCRC 21748 / CBS 615 / JCM 9827 / NBRC 10315 / NRRL Y-1498 / VKM Y-70) TaxID=590646 RepID=G3B5N1_CANTC|nr:sterol-4-alpha-carboxylate 3-dehydrogenase, decarboxylating [Yamadazyma tenuis ATCC 10573]XP_006687392.1 uncharacterized protein CANTEDRAFT_114564 [Yamadazyma tenuis ATCC 10573]EGV63598.1 sterol-4-alpha-carboxylate 3-dehydrogenase, decarboxylating [Yamadazyma tenuis ATCC 10573]EGV63599.1 hypothetical protein CANTEDRAFT_114564 [Yamadazyma tenuis ATCC 10573]WEJ96914.1 erg26, C-3 sterol dehydrogenase [Yamadazyma tenuis]
MSELQSVLLVGGSGFLGLHLIEQFTKGCPKTKIHVFDIRPIPDTISSYFTFDKSSIRFHKGDLTSPEDVAAAIKASKCDVIVHSASPVHGNSDSVYQKVNVEGTINLLETAKKLKVKAMVYTSSAGVIFNGEDIRNANESWPYPKVHMDGYNRTKEIAERAVMASNSEDFLTVCLRPAGIFGPGDRQLVPGLRDVARAGQFKFQVGDNNNLFDWTFVGNVADAHVLAAQKILIPSKASLISGHTFFITNDEPCYFWTLARAVWKADGFVADRNIVISKPIGILIGFISQNIAKLTGKEGGLTVFRVKISNAYRYHDISKAKELLGYNPAVSISEGIRYTLDWMNE